MASAWGSYSELSSSAGGGSCPSSWPPASGSSPSWPSAGMITGNRCGCDVFDPLDRAMIQTKKLGSWDLSAYGTVPAAKEDQECPSWPCSTTAQGFQGYPSGVDQVSGHFVIAGQGIGARSSSSSSTSATGGGHGGGGAARDRFSVVNGTAFLDETADASVVTSSCQFPLPEDCFRQSSASGFRDDSWATLADIDDLLRQSPGYVQANSLEVQSLETRLSPESCRKQLVFNEPQPQQQSQLQQHQQQQQQQQPILIQHDQPAKRLKTPSTQSQWSAAKSQAGQLRQAFQQEPALPPSHVMDHAATDASSIEQLLLLQRAMSYNRTIQDSYGGTSQPCVTNNYGSASTFGDSSLEAAVLYQLGCTMTKLDVGTRICIRNALYRLARSASHRNGDDSMSSVESPGKSIPCLETCTNPIDRTVASLLFYKQDADPAPDQSSGSVSPQSTVVSSSSWIQQPQQLEEMPAAAALSAAAGAHYAKW